MRCQGHKNLRGCGSCSIDLQVLYSVETLEVSAILRLCTEVLSLCACTEGSILPDNVTVLCSSEVTGTLMYDMGNIVYINRCKVWYKDVLTAWLLSPKGYSNHTVSYALIRSCAVIDSCNTFSSCLSFASILYDNPPLYTA